MTTQRRPPQVRDMIREALQVRIELNALAAIRDPLPDLPPRATYREQEVKPAGNHITEAELLMGYRGLRDTEEA